MPMSVSGRPHASAGTSRVSAPNPCTSEQETEPMTKLKIALTTLALTTPLWLAAVAEASYGTGHVV